jgi:hypothetical protein
MPISHPRHDTVILNASPTANCATIPAKISPLAGQGIDFRRSVLVSHTPAPEGLGPVGGDCCIASGNYATIANYLERELRYMDAGE